MEQQLYERFHERFINDFKYHFRGDPHRQASNLSDVILGGQDGLVNVLGVILGVAAATHDPRIVSEQLAPSWDMQSVCCSRCLHHNGVGNEST